MVLNIGLFCKCFLRYLYVLFRVFNWQAGQLAQNTVWSTHKYFIGHHCVDACVSVCMLCGMHLYKHTCMICLVFKRVWDFVLSMVFLNVLWSHDSVDLTDDKASIVSRVHNVAFGFNIGRALVGHRLHGGVIYTAHEQDLWFNMAYALKYLKGLSYQH